MGTDVDRFLANSPAEYLTLGENEVMDAPAVITYTYQPGTPAGDRLYLEAKAGSTMQVAVILRNETAGEGLAALQIKIKAEAGAVVKLSMVQVLDNGFTCLSDIGTTCADGASFELTKLELGSGKLYAGAAADLIRQRQQLYRQDRLPGPGRTAPGHELCSPPPRQKDHLRDGFHRRTGR